MIGFHAQTPVNNWLEGIAELPAGAVCVVVNDYFMARDIKAANPDVIVVFRKWWDNQPQWGGDYNTERARARAYFDAFIDGTWEQQEIWKYIDYVKELNEYNASSNTEPERQLIITHLKAWCDEWNENYRGTSKVGGKDIPLVCLSTPVGNDIDGRYARVIDDRDCVISYHGYSLVQNGNIGGGLNSSQVRKAATRGIILIGGDAYHAGYESDGPVEKTIFVQPVHPRTASPDTKGKEEDWKYYSGRWTQMDNAFRASGLRVKWIGTEGGPFGGVLEGWRHSSVYNGNLDKYVNEWIPYYMGRVQAWNAQHGSRFIGSCLFTVASYGSGVWQHYLHDAGQMKALAQKIKELAGSAPPPPPPPDPEPEPWHREAWQLSVDEQIARGIPLNPNAGLQQAIFAADMVPVHREITFKDGKVLQAAESLDGSKARRVYIFESGKPISYFTKP